MFVLAEDEPSDQTVGTSIPVLGHFALALTIVERGQLTSRLARGRDRGRDQVPAFLLARLTLSVDLRGGTEGRNLLAAALARMVRAADDVASRLLVIDAERPQVARLYADWGFATTRGPEDDVDPATGAYRTSLRLVAKTSSIRAALPARLLG